MTTREALIQWLLDNGLAEEMRGYGHASAEEIAEKLIADGWVAEVER